MFKKRVGPSPHEAGTETPNASNCPDIWELENGDFAVIGSRKTSLLMQILPDDASCGPDEEIVIVPRSTLINAKSDIPGE